MNRKNMRTLVRLNITKMKEWIVQDGKKKVWNCIENNPDVKIRLRFRNYYTRALKSLEKKGKNNA